MANIPANETAIVIQPGSIVNGFFSGFTVLPLSNENPQTQVSQFDSLVDRKGNELVPSGSSLFFLAGHTYPIYVTKATLNNSSNANVLFYT